LFLNICLAVALFTVLGCLMLAFCIGGLIIII
jgi:hypothetical protein